MRISDWSSDVCSSDLKAARFFGSEAALYFANGFAANVALFASLPQRGDLILADELIHASAHDGLRMTSADHMFAPHTDVNAFDEAIRTLGAGGDKYRQSVV